jgi:hypothetical protein
MYRGKLVDKRVTRIVNLIGGHAAGGVELFYACVGLKPLKEVKDAYARGVAKRLDAFSRTVLKALADAGMIPVASQVPVGSVNARVATAVDIVCMNHRSEFEIVELKTGFEALDCGNAQMAGAFGALRNDACSQHHVQASCTRELFAHTFPTLKVRDAYVATVNRTGCELALVPSGIHAMSRRFLLLRN